MNGNKMGASQNRPGAPTSDFAAGPFPRWGNAILATLQVIFVLTVMATLHLAMVVHEFTLKREHRSAGRKSIRPHHVTG
jgi:hypothetical protein